MSTQNQSGGQQPNPQSDQKPGQQEQGGQQGGQQGENAPKPDQQQQK